MLIKSKKTKRYSRIKKIKDLSEIRKLIKIIKIEFIKKEALKQGRNCLMLDMKSTCAK